MGALKIDCYSSETQMSGFVRTLTSHIYEGSNYDGYVPSDFEDLANNVRVCVDFDIIEDLLAIKLVLVQDWANDIDLYADTAVLTQRLQTVINEFNKEYPCSRDREENILKDQLEYENY